MKKFLLSIAAVGMAMCAYADVPTYNFFDPADCDADGWLWLDSQEKIDKYVGVGKKIILVPAQYQLEDPEFPGEYYVPESFADPAILGYNTEGVQGGEGSKTGGIILPGAKYDEEEDYFPTEGGGILVAMPDCALFELYISQPASDIYTAIYAAKFETSDYSECTYVWDDEPYYDWGAGEYLGGPVSTNHVWWGLNLQDIKKDLNLGEGEPDWLSYYGAKGEPRTALFYNYDYDTMSDMYIQGLHILTYTDVSDANVEGVAADDLNVSFDGKCVKATVPVEISVYDLCGAKVAGTNGTSLDCSALNGVYLVKAGNKALKVVL